MAGRVLAVLLISCALLAVVKGEYSDAKQSERVFAGVLRHILELVGVHVPRKNVPVDKDVVQYMLNLYNAHQAYLEGQSMTSPLLYDDETVWGIPTVEIQGSLTVVDRQNGRLRFAADLTGLEGTTSSQLTRARLRVASNSVEDCRLRVAFYDKIGHQSGIWRRIVAATVLQSERKGERIEVNVRNLVGGWLRKKAGHRHNTVIIDVDPVGCDDDSATNGTKLPFLVVYASPHQYPLPRPGSHSRSERAVKVKPNKKNSARVGGCELLEMNVDFVAWGWNDWIIAPRSYDARVCKGSCVAYRFMKFSPHAKAIALAQLSITHLLGAPSCAPSKLQNRTMLLKLDDGTLTVKNLRGMVATDCQCR